MSSILDADKRLSDLIFTDREMTLIFRDGRRLTVPLWKYPRLLKATPEQRSTWRIIGPGRGIHWPEIDEDLTVAGILEGRVAAGAVPPVDNPEPAK
jgi:hypothetical protein